jgi:branched-chain amino acid aminotransferase
MAGAYDDRDGWIWMDGKLVDWRQANVHVLTHAMHYASSVFEGERAYNGKIFESRRHSERLLGLGPVARRRHPLDRRRDRGGEVRGDEGERV